MIVQYSQALRRVLPPSSSLFLPSIVKTTLTLNLCAYEMASILLSKSERAYTQASLQATPPLRADGRDLLDFRTVLLETGVAPLANGSARLNIGKIAREGGGGTEILAAVKLEVEDVETGDGVDGGRVVCSVTWCVDFISGRREDELTGRKTAPRPHIRI